MRKGQPGIERIATQEIKDITELNNCAFVLLGHGRFALIDREDAERVNKYLWSSDGKYVKSYLGKSYTGTKRKMEYLHRFVMGITDDREVDHKNRNGLDCRKENLRPANRLQQCGNTRKKAPNSTSVYKGVSIDRKNGMWRARAKENYKCLQIGYFATQIEAARAYNAWAIKRFGEFARINPGI